jgi:hypothetical protein
MQIKTAQVNFRLEDQELATLQQEANAKGISVSELVRQRLGFSIVDFDNSRMNQVKLVPVTCFKHDPGVLASVEKVTAWVVDSDISKIQKAFKPGERISLKKLHKLKVDIRKVEPIDRC